MRHPNQKPFTVSVKRAIETDQYEYIKKPEVPEYIKKNCQYNKEVKPYEM